MFSCGNALPDALPDALPLRSKAGGTLPDGCHMRPTEARTSWPSALLVIKCVARIPYPHDCLTAVLSETVAVPASAVFSFLPFSLTAGLIPRATAALSTLEFAQRTLRAQHPAHQLTPGAWDAQILASCQWMPW